MEKEFKKIVCVTGATSGIGEQTAIAFARGGYPLILTGRRKDRLQELADRLSDKYVVPVYPAVFDIRDEKAVEDFYNGLPEEWQNVEILVNNAGLAKGLAPVQEGNLEHWETMIDTNIKGLLYITRLISKTMANRKSGHIINVCSTAGKEVYPNGNVYCATKHAVDALTKGMRLDLYKYGIRVGQVAPGHVEETEFALVRFDGDKEKARIYDDFQPLKSKDVAEAIYFMATRPVHVNIQDIVLMGTQQANSIFIDKSGRE